MTRIITARRALAVLPEIGSISTPGGEFVTASTGYMHVARSGSANIGVNGAPFTINIGLRASPTPADNNRTGVTAGANYSGTEGNIIWDADDSTQTRGFLFGLDDGRLYFSVNASGGARTIIGTTDIRTGVFGHAAFERLADGTLSVYWNGTREATNAGPSGNVDYIGSGTANDQHRHIVGKEKLNVTGGFDGDISEIRVSSSARYNAAASYSVQGVPFTPDGDTVALYRFDEPSGNSVTDHTGNGHAGTLAGSPVPGRITADVYGGA